TVPAVSRQTTYVNYPRTIHVSEEPRSGSEPEGFMPGQSVSPLPQVPPVPRTPEPGPVAPTQQERPASAHSGPSLADLVNGLRTTYPHPTNRGAPRRVPSPVSIENWLTPHIRLGRLGPDDYAHVLAQAGKEAADAEANPDAFRVLLKNWIKENDRVHLFRLRRRSPRDRAPTDHPRRHVRRRFFLWAPARGEACSRKDLTH
ncbi:hypothetical protein LCGC14_2432730, partial [marine sediment metagenome]